MREPIEPLLARLVQINSVNPFFDPDAPGEAEIAGFIADYLRRHGCHVRLVGGDRPSVIATVRGTGGGRSLMLNGHIDTVGVEGMAEPFSGRLDGGRLYGRGAYDMKASIAAAMTAIAALAQRPPQGDVVLTAVADEEYASAGTEEVLREVHTDGGICLEPTSLAAGCAHKGFVWIEVRMHGVAAHGSRFELGVDANLKMGRFLGRLDRLEEQLRSRTPHPLVGPPSLHAARLTGGTGWSTYAAECVLQIERRTIPGETVAGVVAEIEALGADEVHVVFAREPFETSASAAIVEAVRAAGAGPIVGDTPWMDASLMSSAGIETVILGPHGGGAHAAEEWVDLASTAQLAEILVRAAYGYCGEPSSSSTIGP